jgi:hypothetical protein
VILAGTTLAAGRMAPGRGVTGTDLTMVVAPSGELELPTRRPFLGARDMRPGDVVRGSITPRNQTARPLRLRLRALPSSPELDHALRVRVASGATTLYDGPLSGLRRWTRSALRLGVSRHARIAFRAELGRSPRGHIVDVPIELRASVGTS